MTEKKEEKKTAPVFSKSQLVASDKYSPWGDLLTAVLRDGKVYTGSQVDEIIRKYKNKEVR